MIDVLTNQRELQIESKRVRASCMRFYAEEENRSVSERSSLDRQVRTNARHSRPRRASGRIR